MAAPTLTPTSPALDFAAVFEHSPNPYMVLDRDLRYVAANRAYLRVTASTLEDLVGRRVLDVFPHDPDDPGNESARMLHASLSRVVETGEVDVLALIPYRVPIYRAGTFVDERFWSATHTPILDASGRVAFVLQHTVDVTELHSRKHAPPAPTRDSGAAMQAEAGVLVRAEQVQQSNVQLDEERRRLRALFQQAPGFMCFLRGPALVFDLANDAYFRLVGRRDILGKPVLEALPEVAGQGFVEKLDYVFATGEPFVGRGIRARLQRQAGGEPDELLLDFVYQPIVDADGNVAGIFVQGHDITEQNRLQSQLEAMFYQQKFLAEAIPQQIWTAIADGRLDFVNARVTEYFGETAHTIVGNGWQQFVHADDLPPCMERWHACIRSGETYEVEFRLRRADGQYRWHLARAVAMRDAAGRVTKWFGTNTDVDDVKRAQDELQRRAAFDQQLIGIVSHDLRNPLNAIAMATSLLLKRGHLDDQQGKIVARIISSSERATRLIRDFLDFTHARSAGRLPIAPRPANIREIAQQVFDEVRLMHAEQPATIEHVGEDTGLWDPDRLEQLVGNLVANAFQHSGPDGRIRVATRGTADAVTIEVQNDGEPIEPDALGRLFEPFERGTRGSTRSGSSVGLGLFIAKQIVQAHRGTIAARSTPESGTVFTVRLPRDAS